MMWIWDTFRQALQVTAFVAVMMLVVEYVNVLTRGAWPANLATSPWKQYLIAVVLGATPGCMGAFAVVTLYTHGVVSRGALVACMIATSGDESFVMLALFPGKALLLSVGLAGLGLVVGAITDRLTGPSGAAARDHGLAVHRIEQCRCFPSGEILGQLRRPSPARGALTTLLVLFVSAVAAGCLGPETWNWLRLTLLGVGGFTLFIVLTVPDHFLDEHLWRHTTLQHVPRVFAWTFGALIVIAALERFVPEVPSGTLNPWAWLGVAGLLGVIPESGPQLIVVTMFDRGLLPLGVLVASCVVQDGHGMLPLLAHSRREFLEVKAINLVTGLLVGAAVLAM